MSVTSFHTPPTAAERATLDPIGAFLNAAADQEDADALAAHAALDAKVLALENAAAKLVMLSATLAHVLEEHCRELQSLRDSLFRPGVAGEGSVARTRLPLGCGLPLDQKQIGRAGHGAARRKPPVGRAYDPQGGGLGHQGLGNDLHVTPPEKPRKA